MTVSLVGTGRIVEVVRLAAGVEVLDDHGITRLSRGGRSPAFPDTGLLAALLDGVDPASLTRNAEERGDLRAALATRALLAALDAGGFLDRYVSGEAGSGETGPAVLLHPVAVGPTALAALPASWRPAPWVSADVRGGALVLQAASGGLEAHLPAGAAERWLRLSAGEPPGPGDTPLLRALATAGVLEPDVSPTSGAAAWWSAREWALHRQSRDPSVSPGFAGTGRRIGLRAGVPAWAPPGNAQRVALRRPDLATRRTAEPPFVDVVEGRQSRRSQDDEQPVTVDALAELLYRTVRVTGSTRSTGGTGDGPAVVRRPVPSGGSLHPLEVLAVVRRCDGLEAGTWWYDDQAHELVRVADAGPVTDRMLGNAGAASGTSTEPQVLLVLAARFGRLMEKYEAIGYALVLKDVGVLMYALQLTAEAMGLAACPYGAGQAADFEQLTGADPFEFGGVGELGLGSRGPDDTGSWF